MRFNREHLFSGSLEDLVALVAAAAVVTTVLQVRRRRTGHYQPDVAWLRAGAYLGGATLLAWSTGVLTGLLRGVAAPAASGFALATAAAVAVNVVGYWVLWPMGTSTQDRPSRPALQIGFGAAWGLAQGMVFLSFWAVAEWLGASPGWASVAAGVVTSTYQGTLHRLWWDVHVSPEHNDPAWDARKVAFAHTPNLIASLGHFARFGAPWVFVLLQVVALTGASLFMRFPGPEVHPRTPRPEAAA